MQSSKQFEIYRRGLSPAVFFGKCLLVTYNIAGFRDNLIAKHTGLRTQITDIVAEYE
jgi:hypothetical protein